MTKLQEKIRSRVQGWVSIHGKGLHMAGGRAEAAASFLHWIQENVWDRDQALDFLINTKAHYESKAKAVTCDSPDYRWARSASIEIDHLLELVHHA